MSALPTPEKEQELVLQVARLEATNKELMRRLATRDRTIAALDMILRRSLRGGVDSCLRLIADENTIAEGGVILEVES